MKSRAAEDIIRIENLTFSYPAPEEGTEPQTAVDDISLYIEEGSFVTVLGQNGSGKSTLIKTINALLSPSRGDVFVCGMNTKDEELVWEIRRSAGMVFQNPDNQLVSAIVEDDVAFGPENLGIPAPEIRERIDDAMKRTGIFGLRKKSPHMLSGGQKQRVAIAGVIAMRPKCILFDEATAMLDPRGRCEVMQIIRSLKKEGITVLLITHFMEEAVRADRVMIMHEGKILLDGTPAEVFSQGALIKSVNLDVPPIVELADELRAVGISVPDEIITEEEMVAYVCQYE